MVTDFTAIDLTWSDPFNIFDDYLWIKIIQISVPIMSLVLGNALLLGMISYEKYGEDPQKRGLLNQIFSQLFSLTIICYWIFIPFRTWRFLISPFNSLFYWIWIVTLSIYIYSVLLYIVEYSIIKFIVVVVKKQVLPLMDDFFIVFFFGFNKVMSLWMLMISSFTIGLNKERLKVLGIPEFLQDMSHMLSFRFYINQTPYCLNRYHYSLCFRVPSIFLTGCFGILLVISIRNKWAIWQHNKDLVVPLNNHNPDLDDTLNNVSNNKEFISPCAGFVIAVLSMLGVAQFIVVKYFLSEELSKLLTTLLMGLLPTVINLAVLPSICYFVNPQLRQYVIGLIISLFHEMRN